MPNLIDEDIDLAPLIAKLRLLPGRIAVLEPLGQDPDDKYGEIFVPRAWGNRQGWTNRPGTDVLGQVIATNPAPFKGKHSFRGHLEDPKVGAVLILEWSGGLFIDHNDRDIRDLGALVPEGHRLRLIGADSCWSIYVIGQIEEQAAA